MRFRIPGFTLGKLVMQQYDFIIAGCGAAGLSLAYYLSQSSLLQKKSVLLLDKDLKTSNDRTWGFWTREPTPYEEIVSYQFDQAEFLSAGFSAVIPLTPYQYQVIEGIRFYDFVRERLRSFPNFRFRQEEIVRLESGAEEALVHTKADSYRAAWVFNSCFLDSKLKEAARKDLVLRQHFKGWVIKTPAPAFNPEQIRLFDFRTPQEGNMRFFYLIPQAPDQALVEYTLFSAQLLEPQAYEQALRRYIKEVLELNEYTIEEEEWGVIPMTTFPFPARQGKRIVHIGSVGGASKPSTGYTFMRIQQQCSQITGLLEESKMPYPEASGKRRFSLYDAMLLNIMAREGGRSEEIFQMLFRNNPIQRILKFLDEESHIGEELLIMNSVPRSLFLQSLLNLKLGLPFVNLNRKKAGSRLNKA